MASSLIVSVVLLAGCGESETKRIDSVQPANGEADPTENSNEQVNEEQQIYIDESKYEGDELKLVKLIHLSTKYRNEGNEQEYLKLFDSVTITSLPSSKITGIQIDKINFMSEKVGSVRTIVQYENSTEPSIAAYTFNKKENEWFITDID
ncbi:hypothetical protein ACE3NQ_08495 [Paenibacillus terreus]|uniref:DUF4878 domain-containing protein n=1 Tax=Paenibacillus terreus TaxID=1387834 RepID=A0ABV5B5J7_9BACL